MKRAKSAMASALSRTTRKFDVDVQVDSVRQLPPKCQGAVVVVGLGRRKYKAKPSPVWECEAAVQQTLAIPVAMVLDPKTRALRKKTLSFVVLDGRSGKKVAKAVLDLAPYLDVLGETRELTLPCEARLSVKPEIKISLKSTLLQQSDGPSSHNDSEASSISSGSFVADDFEWSDGGEDLENQEEIDKLVEEVNDKLREKMDAKAQLDKLVAERDALRDELQVIRLAEQSLEMQAPSEEEVQALEDRAKELRAQRAQMIRQRTLSLSTKKAAPLKVGMLGKQSKHLRRWAPRLVVLTTEGLFSFHPDVARPGDDYDFAASTVFLKFGCRKKMTVVAKRGGPLFEVVVNGQAMVLRASSEAERDLWVRTVEEAVKAAVLQGLAHHSQLDEGLRFRDGVEGATVGLDLEVSQGQEQRFKLAAMQPLSRLEGMECLGNVMVLLRRPSELAAAAANGGNNLVDN